MLKRLLFVFCLPFAADAQTVADFETPALPKVDTFFMRYDLPKQDIGINSGLAHFPLFADTLSGYKYWTGFTCSSETDSVSGGQGNQYAARAGKGVNGSAQYAISYGDSQKVFLLGAAQGRPVSGFYITNATYTWNSIKYGDGFSRKFGDTTGTGSGLPQGSYPDYFRITIQGYLGGNLTPDTVQFYLADYRSADSTKDYAVTDWRWVSLTKLGNVDSLIFSYQSSDTSRFGNVTYINKPLYFCMDNFTTNESVSVNKQIQFAAKVYPNPVRDILHIELQPEYGAQQLSIYDAAGRQVVFKAAAATLEVIDMGGLPSGTYLLQLTNAGGQTASQRISKQ